ncbi:MAG: OmpA family protein [Roseobacter sp.]
MQCLLRTKHALLAAAGVVALAACTAETSQFQREAGAKLKSGGFGSAEENNIAIQTGAQSAMLALAGRFDREVPSMVNFDFNSTVLDAEAQTALRQQAGWISQFPEIRFRVYGHTDAVGSPAYNKRLGQRRAQAVVSFLMSQGIERARLEAVASFGETRPLVATQDRERRNRRTVTEVTGFVKRTPDPLDGKYAAIIYRDYAGSAGQISTVEGADSQ